MVPGKPLESGERVLLLDAKGRRYLIKLQTGGTFHFHGGAVRHDDIIGREEGVSVRSASGAGLVCFRPRLADHVLKMPRGAQVVYPKDLASIVMWADVFPGARVLEAGTGSGALSIALCRALGPQGKLVTYELREEFRAKAAANLEGFFGALPGWIEMRDGDLRQVAHTGEEYDRAVLDMPEPWGVLEALAAVLVPGAVVCAFVPTTVQVQTFVLSVNAAGYQQVDTIETIVRPWHVTERSVRPGHRMIAHTGFIITARLAG